MTGEFRSIKAMALTLIVCWLVGAPVSPWADSQTALPKGGCCGSTGAPALSASCACAGQSAHSGCGEGHVRLASGETTSGDGPSDGGIGILQEGPVMCATDGCAAPDCYLGQCGEFTPPDPPPCGGAATCACNAPAGNCDCGQYCPNFMQPCVYMEMVDKGSEEADGIETCRCLPNYPDCACGAWCEGNGTPDCNFYECGDWGCTAGWQVCGCDGGEGIPNCTPGDAWCSCDVGYCKKEPCGAANCEDYCWETQCPTCGGLSIAITEADPAGPRLYINLGETSTTITARVTRNAQPVQGVTVHWVLEDPDEPHAPSFLDGTPCNCGTLCPDNGKNGKTNCTCGSANCPSHNDDADPNNAPDNAGGGNLDVTQGQTDQNGETQVTLTLAGPHGGDNWDVWAVLCPNPPEHPHGKASDKRRFTVWRRVRVEVDAMEDAAGNPDAFEPAYNELVGGFDDAYVELVTYDDQDNCQYIQYLPVSNAYQYASDPSRWTNPAHTVHLMGVCRLTDPTWDPLGLFIKGWSPLDPANVVSRHFLVAVGCPLLAGNPSGQNKVCMHEAGHCIADLQHPGQGPHSDACVMYSCFVADAIHEFCATCILTMRAALHNE